VGRSAFFLLYFPLSSVSSVVDGGQHAFPLLSFSPPFFLSLPESQRSRPCRADTSGFPPPPLLSFDPFVRGEPSLLRWPLLFPLSEENDKRRRRLSCLFLSLSLSVFAGLCLRELRQGDGTFPFPFFPPCSWLVLWQRDPTGERKRFPPFFSPGRRQAQNRHDPFFPFFFSPSFHEEGKKGVEGRFSMRSSSPLSFLLRRYLVLFLPLRSSGRCPLLSSFKLKS